MPMTSRPSIAAPILAVLAIVLPLLLIGLYVGGYLGMSDYGEGLVKDNGQRIIYRQFPNWWQRTIYWPAGQVEGWLKQTDVYIEPTATP